MAIFLKFLLQASLIVLCLLCSSENTCAKEPGHEGQYPYRHTVLVSSLLPFTVCNRSSKVSSKASLELVHKYGPCSELKKGKPNTPSWSQILLKDQARVHSINSRRRQYMNSDKNQLKQTKSTSFPFGYDSSIGLGEYYAIVDIGTPGQSVYVILDTGSDITWIQCKPCSVQCFKQPGPIFDPSKSSTYSPNIGVIGLSRAPISFVYQTAPLFKNYFSYCFPSDFSSTGYITFGKQDNLNNKYIKFTPIPTTPQQSQFYDVVITGISVAGKKGGAIIDSGTVITRLPPEAYTALRSAFRKEMARYKLAAPDEIIDSTCYDFSSYETVVVPKISYWIEFTINCFVVYLK
ncbi:hypothetical protein ACOSQ4_008143 [Xanthoceras sorbifolium]